MRRPRRAASRTPSACSASSALARSTPRGPASTTWTPTALRAKGGAAFLARGRRREHNGRGSVVEDARGRRQAQGRVEDDAQRRRPGDHAHGQLRIVHDRRPDADEDGVARRTKTGMRDPRARFTRDPLCVSARVAIRPSTVWAYLRTTYGRRAGAVRRPSSGATLVASPIGLPSSGEPAGATCPSLASLARRYPTFRTCGEVCSGTARRLRCRRVRAPPPCSDCSSASGQTRPEPFKTGAARRTCPRVRREAEAAVGLDRVRAVLLKHVGAQLVHEPDPASFLVGCVDEDAAPFSCDRTCRLSKLGAAVAAKRAKRVTRQAFRVEPGQDRPAVARCPRARARGTPVRNQARTRGARTPRKWCRSGSGATSRRTQQVTLVVCGRAPRRSTGARPFIRRAMSGRARRCRPPGATPGRRPRPS